MRWPLRTFQLSDSMRLEERRGNPREGGNADELSLTSHILLDSWNILFGRVGFEGQVEFTSVIYSALLLSKTQSIGKKYWVVKHNYDKEKIYISHKIVRSTWQHMQKQCGSDSAFKLATADAYWYSTMKRVQEWTRHTPSPLSLPELWINQEMQGGW